MKPRILLALTISVALFAILARSYSASTGPADRNSTPPEPQNKTPGRFQLIGASITETGDRTETVHAVFRLDTATGQVWRYSKLNYPAGKASGGTSMTVEAEGWTITTENFLLSYKEAERVANDIKDVNSKKR